MADALAEEEVVGAPAVAGLPVCCGRLPGIGPAGEPLPIEGGVAVAYRRQIAAAEDPDALRRELEDKIAASRKPYPAAESFAVHELIDPRETRPMLCEWVDWIQPQLDTLVGPVRFGMRP